MAPNADADANPNPDQAPAPEAPAIPIRTRISREIRERPLSYILLGAFLILGPITAHFLFPEAPPGAAIAGGLALGVYAALCAVPQKFL